MVAKLQDWLALNIRHGVLVDLEVKLDPDPEPDPNPDPEPRPDSVDIILPSSSQSKT